MVKHFEYPLGSKKLYSGCATDVVKSPINMDDCKKETSLECFAKVMKDKPIDYTTTFIKTTRTFVIRLLDDVLIKWLDKDENLKNIFIAPHPAKCSLDQNYKSKVKLSTMTKATGIEISFEPDVYCARILKNLKTTSFRIYRGGENGANAKKMQYFSIGVQKNGPVPNPTLRVM